jgi:hypothetical protein
LGRSVIGPMLRAFGLFHNTRIKSLCVLCVLCASVVISSYIHHRDTENTEVAQRKLIFKLTVAVDDIARYCCQGAAKLGVG